MIQLKIAGIDYGSKLAGTTVIAFWNEQNQIAFAASKKNQDADRFILDWVDKNRPSTLFVDAPLSLPGIYKNLPGCHDYFYRKADKAVHAMSPMFLGGLTARAMKLHADLQAIGVAVLEVYPGYLAKFLQLDTTLYKKQKENIPNLLIAIHQSFSELHPSTSHPFISLSSWHHFDALLALLSGIRYQHGTHLTFGDTMEGLIII